MSIEVKVPMLPESVADATVVTWHKKPGENVKRDDNLVDLETDKVVLEVPAPADGVMGEILKQVGTVVKAGEILAHLNTDKEASMKTAKPSASTSTSTSEAESSKPVSPATENLAGPAARRSAAEQGLSLENIPGSGKSGRVTREDVLNQSQAASPASTLLPDGMKTDSNRVAMSQAASRLEKRVPMTRLRARIAERLVAAQHNAAILTTFNEIDLHKVIELRNRYKESFEKDTVPV